METVNYELVELVDNCQTTLSAIKNTNHPQHLSMFFENFIGNLSLCLEALQKQIVGNKKRNLIMLCICQTRKCLPLLLQEIETIVGSNLLEFRDSKRYLIDRMHWCLDGILTEIQRDVKDEPHEPCGSKFVHTMDAALEAINKLTNITEFEFDELKEALHQLKLVVEEVLCHAMTIVQISGKTDFQVITYSSQKILSVLEQFRQKCLSASPDPALCGMFANSLTESMESLEQQVNTAVLRLVLQVFCEPYAPLQRLVESCISEKPVADRHSADLDLLIVDFDLFMDRVMQIGLFAMACSGDNKRILSTRSCLASIESLEPELVPTLTALYLEPNNSSHRNYLKLLTSHWKKEIGTLHDLIDGIVDPAAFCQVTVEETSLLVSTAIKASTENQPEVMKENLKKVIEQSKKLVRHLKLSIAEFNSEATNYSELHMMLKKLNQACHELDACANLVFTHKVADDETQWNRVLKRSQLVISTMKKMEQMLFLIMDTTPPQKKEKTMNFEEKSGEGLLFPESVSDLTIDETVTSAPGSIKYEWLKNPLHPLKKGGHYGKQKDLNCLTPYLDAGKILSQERSVLYMTPKHGQAIRTPLSVGKLIATAPRTQRRLFTHNTTFDCTAANENIASQTLGLDLTDILDKMTMLSDTLTSLPNETLVNEKIEPAAHKLSCLLEEGSVDQSTEEFHSLSSSSAVSDSSHVTETASLTVREEANRDLSLDVTLSSSNSNYQIDTYDRLNDLNNIEKRLKGLRENHT